MSRHLPDQFDPWRFADHNRRVAGTYPLAELPRLRDCLEDRQGEVRFDLTFSRDARNRACVHGRVDADLRLKCQRCLEVMSLAVRSVLSLAFVEGLDEAERLPDQLDPQLVEQGRVVLREMIEDELLLTLPQVAMHPYGECSSGQASADEQPATVDDNPFAVLADLKRRDA